MRYAPPRSPKRRRQLVLVASSNHRHFPLTVKSPKSIALLILTLAAAGVAMLAWRQYQELIELRAAAVGNDERADLQKRLWAAEKRAKDLADQLAAARTRGPGGPGSPGREAELVIDTGDGGRGGRGGGAGAMIGNMMALMDRPEIQKLMALQQKAQLDSRYAALFKSLNLSPEQLDKFKNLLVEKQTALQDVLAAARTQGIDPRSDPEGFRKMITDTQAEADANIKAALGDAAFTQYQNYQQTLPQRTLVSQLQQSLSYTGAPLSDTQAEQMVGILAQTAPRNEGGTNRTQLGFAANVTVAVDGPGGGGPAGGAMINVISGAGGGGAVITNEAIAQSQRVLSAPQVQALQQLQQQQQTQQQLQQTIRQTMGGPGGAPPTGGTATTTSSAGKR
jgi:hypothetical protein